LLCSHKAGCVRSGEEYDHGFTPEEDDRQICFSEENIVERASIKLSYIMLEQM
jgi:hypothetical protein